MPLKLSAAMSASPSCGLACLRDEVAVPVRAVLGQALLGGVVDVDQSEAFGITGIPLVVVAQAPVEEAAHIHAFGAGSSERFEMAPDVGDARVVIDLAIDHAVRVGH